MAMRMKSREVSQTISPGLAMLGKNALQFYRNLNNDWLGEGYNPVWRRNGRSRASAKCNIYYPVIPGDHLLVTQLGNYFSGRSATCN